MGGPPPGIRPPSHRGKRAARTANTTADANDETTPAAAEDGVADESGKGNEKERGNAARRKSEGKSGGHDHGTTAKTTPEPAARRRGGRENQDKRKRQKGQDARHSPTAVCLARSPRTGEGNIASFRKNFRFRDLVCVNG